jgi:hypothetical protein
MQDARSFELSGKGRGQYTAAEARAAKYGIAMEAPMRPFILDLPPELMFNVLEHVDTLDDLASLLLTNKGMADLGRNIRAKTLWRITMRSGDCWRHDDGPCGLVQPVFEEPESRPFKVRAWLYRRASLSSFGTSEEALGRCIVLMENDMTNPYDAEKSRGPLSSSTDSHEECRAKVKEWAKLWCIFKRHLVMQRVQRVNVGDESVRPEWRRSYEPGKDEDKDSKEDTALVEALREANGLMGRERDRNVLNFRRRN